MIKNIKNKHVSPPTTAFSKISKFELLEKKFNGETLTKKENIIGNFSAIELSKKMRLQG